MQSDKELRFWAKVHRGAENDCWIWIGAKRGSRQPRGCFWNGARVVDSARWLWEHLHSANLSAVEVVMHKCDVALCVNPSHLTIGSQADNVADMWAKGRANVPGICAGAAKGRHTLAERPELRARGNRHGVHQRDLKGQANPFAVLSESDVLQIRELSGSISQRKIAERFGVNQASVWRIVHRKSWGHI